MSRLLMPALAIMLSLAATGCGYWYKYGCEEEDPWSFDICQKLDECGWLEDNDMTLEDCWTRGDVEETGGDVWEYGDHDERAEKRCLKDWEKLDCDELTDEGTFSSCEDICSND